MQILILSDEELLLLIGTELSSSKKKCHVSKKSGYKSCRNGKNNNNIHIQWLMRLQLLQEDIHKAIEISKLNYYSLITYKLTHIQTFFGYC